MDKKPPPEAYKPGTVLTVGSHTAVITKYISEGGFAHVYLVEISPKVNNSSIACLKRVAVPDKASLNTLRAEVDSMKRLSGHRHIVSYIDSHAARRINTDGYEVFVLMEYCANKGLIDFMNTRLQNRLTEAEVLKIMAEITEGVCNMHALSPPLVHRDIKIENVLISANGDFKLCDFGSASPVLRPPRNSDEFAILQNDVLKNTTPQYRSPEMVDLYRGLPIDEKSDIWALGVFLYKLCYYTTPFEAKGELAILHSSFEFPSRPVYSDRLKNLISVLLREDPRRRPNAYQTLEEVCRMRNLPVPIPDYTKAPKPPRVPKLPVPPPQIHTPVNGNSLTYKVSSSSSTNDIQAINNLKPIKAFSGEPQTRPILDKVDPFKDLNRTDYLSHRPEQPPAKPPRPNVGARISNFQNLNKSMGSLTLNSGSTSSSMQPVRPTAPPRSKYVDSTVQTDDTGEPKSPPVPRVKNKRPQSMYVQSVQSRSNSNGSKLGQNSSNDGSELKRIITGLSSQANTVELSPGENNHIDSSVAFLKNLEQQDSGKSWVQQHTGGSIKSLRRISTGSKKRNSLISQLTGKFSRPQSRNSSRASSINESAGIYPHNTGTSTKFRSSSESIEEEASYIQSPEPPKLKRSSSIQRRVQALMNRNNDPPILKTASGYGPSVHLESNVDEDGFKKPILVPMKPTIPSRKQHGPITPPSLSAQSTPSTITQTPKTQHSAAALLNESPSTAKKPAPPPKPAKPSYLKSKANRDSLKVPQEVLARTTSRESELSLTDIDEWEQKFNEKYPSAL